MAILQKLKPANLSRAYIPPYAETVNAGIQDVLCISGGPDNMIEDDTINGDDRFK